MQSFKNDKPAQRSDYPCLKQCTSSGTVVLFISSRNGVVVYEKDGRGIGTYDYDDADKFVPFTGTITLQN